MARKRLADRYRSQVQAESTLRFDPERTEILQTRDDVFHRLRGDLAAAHAARRGVVASAKQAGPEIGKILRTALGQVATTPSPTVAQSELGAAAGRDAQGTQRRLRETMARAATEFKQRQVDAVAGEHLAVANARSAAAGDLDRLGSRLGSLARQEGAFAQGRIGELTESARARGVTKRGQTLTHQDRVAGQQLSHGDRVADRQSRERIAAQKKKDAAKKKKALSPERLERAQSEIALGQAQANRLKGGGRSRSEALQLLVTGRPASSVDDPKTGTKLKVPGVKAVRDVFARVAVEQAYNGRISSKTANRLRRLGYSPSALGLRVNSRVGSKGVVVAPGANGQQRPT